MQAAGVPPEAEKAESILVVDDEPQIRDLLKEFFSARGYQVRVAADGQQTLALVDQKSPDLIVLDVHMRGMNGIEVLKKLRAGNYVGGVVLLTSSQDETLLQTALDLGSVDILGKPIERQSLELMAQVGLILATP